MASLETRFRAACCALLVGATLGLAALPPAAAQDLPADPGGADAPVPEAPVIDAGETDVLGAILDGPSEPAGGFAFQPAAPAATPVPAAPALIPPSAAGARAAPVVVELFTSQGCAPCLSADAMLADLASRGDVLALGLHVDTWDYLGWPDSLARPEFTARQRSYARRNGERGLMTPQFVVGGVDTALDLSPATLESLIRSHRRLAGAVRITTRELDGRIVVDLAPGEGGAGASSVILARYLPNREVAIWAGENRGQTVDYANAVLSLETVASWDGKGGLRITVTPRGGTPAALPEDTRHAIIVQQGMPGAAPGAILAAVRLD